MVTRARVPIALGSGGTGSEEGRAFFQSRLTLFGCWVFLISGGFLLVGVALNAAFQTPFNAGMVFHQAGVLVAGAIWGIGRLPASLGRGGTRCGRHRDTAALRQLLADGRRICCGT